MISLNIGFVIFVYNTCFLCFDRGPAQANLAFALLRTYFFLISASRRVEVLTINVDDKNWTVEAHLRLILLPSPSREDRTLPANKLRKVLESKAK